MSKFTVTPLQNGRFIQIEDPVGEDTTYTRSEAFELHNLLGVVLAQKDEEPVIEPRTPRCSETTRNGIRCGKPRGHRDAHNFTMGGRP